MKQGRNLFVAATAAEAKAAASPPRPRIVAYGVVTQFNTLRIWWQTRPAGLPELGFSERFVELIEADGDLYDRGRRDMLNAILDLNPAVSAKVAEWAGRPPDPQGKIPWEVALWVTEVAAQLGIRSAEELAEEGEGAAS
jgi:hypothetical protein